MTQAQRQVQNTSSEAVFNVGDVGRVDQSYWSCNLGKTMYKVTELSNSRCAVGVDPAYMRLLPPADAMRDIDTAPLCEPDAGAMSAAAVAWLRQHLRQDSSALPVRP